jgi:osmotically-inducible protein OsmY
MTIKNDKDLQHDVMEDLRWDPSIDASKIGVATSGGVVTLTGAVPSYFQKQTAERITKRVAGVRAVANDIDVQLPSAVEKTDAGVRRYQMSILRYR